MLGESTSSRLFFILRFPDNVCTFPSFSSGIIQETLNAPNAQKSVKVHQKGGCLRSGVFVRERERNKMKIPAEWRKISKINVSLTFPFAFGRVWRVKMIRVFHVGGRVPGEDLLFHLTLSIPFHCNAFNSAFCAVLLPRQMLWLVFLCYCHFL